MEFLAYIAIAVIAYYIGWHARGIIFLSNISENPDRMIKMLEQIKKINEEGSEGLPPDAIEVQTEVVNGTVFAYNKITGEFLAQATDLHNAMQDAAKRYPGKKFWHPEIKEDSQTA
jgi:hypothetical protein